MGITALFQFPTSSIISYFWKHTWAACESRLWGGQILPDWIAVKPDPPLSAAAVALGLPGESASEKAAHVNMLCASQSFIIRCLLPQTKPSLGSLTHDSCHTKALENRATLKMNIYKSSCNRLWTTNLNYIMIVFTVFTSSIYSIYTIYRYSSENSSQKRHKITQEIWWTFLKQWQWER